MKTVTDLIPAIGAMVPEDVSPVRIPPQTANVVNALFRELQAIFPAWRQAWPDDDTLKAAKRSWTKAFMAQGISRIGQIRHGIDHCRQLQKPFAPSVGEFIAMCRPTPEMLGLPGSDAAFAQAVANAHPGRAQTARWSHRVVYHAAVQCGFEALARLPVDVSRRLFERHYQITVRMMLDGAPLRHIPAALPERPTARRTPDVGKQALAELRRACRPAHGSPIRSPSQAPLHKEAT